METSSLPRYPQATPPPMAPPAASSRTWILLFQFLVIAAFWVGIYVLHRQALAFAEAYKKAEERAKISIEGKWDWTRDKDVILEMREGKFRFTRDGKVVFDGEYTKAGNSLSISTLTGSSYRRTWQLPCQLTAEELVIWDDPRDRFRDFVLHVLRKILGGEAGFRALTEEPVLRFKRRSG